MPRPSTIRLPNGLGLRASRCGKRNTTQLLVTIGIPRSKISPSKSRSNHAAKAIDLGKTNKSSRNDLWNRNEWELMDILNEAREIYRKRIKKLHPDMPGGSHNRAVSLNLAWDGVVKMFDKRGITLNP